MSLYTYLQTELVHIYLQHVLWLSWLKLNVKPNRSKSTENWWIDRYTICVAAIFLSLCLFTRWLQRRRRVWHLADGQRQAMNHDILEIWTDNLQMDEQHCEWDNLGCTSCCTTISLDSKFCSHEGGLDFFLQVGIKLANLLMAEKLATLWCKA